MTTDISQNAESAEDRLAAELSTATATRDKLAQLLLDEVRRDARQWQLHGAVLTEITRILELDTEHRSRRLMEELDRGTREERERRDHLVRLRQRLRDAPRAATAALGPEPSPRLRSFSLRTAVPFSGAGADTGGSGRMADDAVRIDGNTLRLPGGVRVRFMRTLRLPETGTHELPPGLGEFPVRRVEDHADTVPAEWRARGGVMLPVYLREAMWLSFAGSTERQRSRSAWARCARSRAGRGAPCSPRTRRTTCVSPRQRWLDGINSGKGTVRQFVAVPLGLGATVEGQVTGEEVGRPAAAVLPAE